MSYTNIYIDRNQLYNTFNKNKQLIVHLWDDEKGYIRFPTYNIAYEKTLFEDNPNATYTSIFGEKLIKRIFRNTDDVTNLIEYDVPIETRILIDLYGNSDEPSSKNRIVFFDIETDASGGFPDVKLANQTVTAISIYDSILEKYICWILDENKLLNTKLIDNIEIIPCETEYELLNRFCIKINEIHPTILTGWNSEGFDIPYLFNRITHICGKDILKLLSPIGIVYKTKFDVIKIAGISLIDYMNLYKKFSLSVEPSYALNYIGNKIVNIGKIKFSGSLTELFKRDINKYIEYNINDVRIMVALENKLKYIEEAIALAHKCHVQYECYEKSTVFIEGAILTYLRRENLVSKNKPDKNSSLNSYFQGAYVKSPKPGKYYYVFDLDAKSLYPSIIRTLNISPETKRERVLNWNIDKFLKGELDPIIGNETVPNKDFKAWLARKNYSIAANGVMYSLDKHGIIPKLLEKWGEERDEYRALEKKYGNENNTSKYEYYHRTQIIVKRLSNSVYGVLGEPSFRFYDRENADAVTSSGQFVIKSAERAFNYYVNKLLNNTIKQDYVIYIDTDSLFGSTMPILDRLYPDVQSIDEKIKLTLEISTDIQNFINKIFDTITEKCFNVTKHFLKFKQEMVAKSAFWVVKKRYCQHIIKNNGIDCDEFDIKGLDVNRSSFPIAFSKFYKQFLKDILLDNTETEISNSILTFERNLENEDIINLAKNTSVMFETVKLNDFNEESVVKYDFENRMPFTFIKSTPAQVKAALSYNDLLKYYKLNKKCEPITNGSKIKWVYLKQNEFGIDAIALKADDTDPVEILEFISKYIDKQKMYDRELKSKIIKFYDILKWNYPSLVKDAYNTFRKKLK